MIDALLLMHALLTTGGYVGLIAATAYLLFLARSRDAQVIRTGLVAWRQASRLFGACLLLGVFFGFGLAWAAQVPLGSVWLVWTYALIAAAIGVQASVMVPWQLRSDRILGAAGVPRMTPVVAAMTLLSIMYASILWLMLVRPG